MYIGPYRNSKYEGNPWHPRPFIEGKIDTLPYQHDSVVLYSGISPQIFWIESETFEECRNNQSALRTNYIYAGNSYYREENIDLGQLDNEDPGVWCGVLSIARIFAEKCNSDRRKGGGAVIEIQVPSSEIGTLAARKELRQNENYTIEDFVSLPDLKSVLDEFDPDEFDNPEIDSPVEAYREYLKIAARAESSSAQGEVIHHAVPHEVHLSRVKGVWDLRYSRKQIWESPEDYVKGLKSRWPDKMPAGVDKNDFKEHIVEETRALEQVRDITDEMVDRLLFIKIGASQSQRKLKKPEYYVEEEEILLRDLEKYQNYLNDLKEILKIELDLDLNFYKVSSVQEFLDEIEYWRSHSKDLHNNLDEMIQETKYEAHKENYTIKDVKKEINAEEIIENNLKEDLKKLPDFRQLIEFLENNDLENVAHGKVSRTITKMLGAISFNKGKSSV